MAKDENQPTARTPAESSRIVLDPAAGDMAGSVVAHFEGQWWVLYTRSRHEKMVAAHLARSRIQHFLPLVVRRRRSRRIWAGAGAVPLFPGYVFLCGRPEDRLEALRTNRVAKILDVPDPEGLKADLLQIELAVRGDEPIDLYPKLRTGRRCRVVAGSLAGLEGVVLKRRGPWRVYVGVEFLGQSAELEIDPSMLELID